MGLKQIMRALTSLKHWCVFELFRQIIYSHTHTYIYIYEVHTISFQNFFICAIKIVVDSWKFSMLLLYILWPTNFYDFRFKWTATAEIGMHPTKDWLAQLLNFKNAIWSLEERYAIKLCFKLGKIPQKRMQCFRLLLEHLAWIEWHKRFKEGR